MKTIQFSIRKGVHAIFPIFLFVFCFAFTSQAITYYVSPAGNDVTGNGTAGSPWKTLYKATTAVTTSGSIIHVNAGTYVETQECPLAVGVSIEGDGVTSVIKSSLTADWTVIIKAISPEGTNGNQHISNLKFDGQNLSTFWGVHFGGRSNVSMYNCTIVDFKDRGVMFGGRNDIAGAPPTIYATGNSFHHNTMHNCAGYNLPTGIYGRGCLNIGGQDGMLIYNNTITQTQRPDGYNGWPIKGWNEGYLKGCKIYNNTLTKIPFAGSYGGEGGWDFCIELFNEQGLEIYGNTIQGAIDMNYQSKGSYAYSVWIHDNVISQPVLNDNYESGIVFEYYTDGAIVENNTLDKVSGAIQFNTRTGNTVSNITIRKNLMSNIGRATGNGNNGVFVGVYNEGSPAGSYNVSNFNIYNNTMVAEPNNRPHWGIDLGGLDNGYERNISIKNNIILNAYTGFLVQGGAHAIDTLVLQNNNTYNNGNNNNPYFNGLAATNFTNLNNTHVVPQFVSTVNYQLQVASPCIDAGIYLGLPYSGSAPDKGFAETGIILPVTLINFGVTENQGKNLLQWTTATESNSDYISIERSSDGRNFTAIGSVKAAGYSSADIHYSFTDASPLSGINYYRLALVDKDNSKGYSNTVAATNKSNTSLNIATAQLSRSNNNIQLTVVSAQTQKTSIALFDANGKLFLNETVQLQKGMNSINKNTRALSSGIYYIKLSGTDETVVKNVLSKE